MMADRVTRAALFVILAAAPAQGAGPAKGGGTPTPPAPAPLVHPAAGDRLVLLHEKAEATHIVATRRPEDLRSKEILLGDGMEVGDVAAFFKSSKVPLAAIPAGTTGVVLDTLGPWRAGNELPAVKVGITSGPLDGQSWWVSTPGVAVRKTADGDRRIARWEAEVRAGRRKDPRRARAYVSPEPSRPSPRR